MTDSIDQDNSASESFSLDTQTFGEKSEYASDIESNDEVSELTSINDKMSSVNLNKKYEIISNTGTYNNYYQISKKTSPYLTKYEKAKILGVRAQMISTGSPAMVNVPNHITSTYEIALLEFKEDKIPLLIRRFLPDGNYEDWRLEDMILK